MLEVAKTKILLVAGLGVLGVLTRFFIQLSLSRWLSLTVPVTATFLINVVGSFAIGIFYVLGFERGVLGEDLRAGILVGFLGGFTTFSSYSLETMLLLEQSRFLLASAYWIASPVLGLAAAWGGLWITRSLL